MIKIPKHFEYLIVMIMAITTWISTIYKWWFAKNKLSIIYFYASIWSVIFIIWKSIGNDMMFYAGIATIHYILSCFIITIQVFGSSPIRNIILWIIDQITTLIRNMFGLICLFDFLEKNKYLKFI